MAATCWVRAAHQPSAALCCCQHIMEISCQKEMGSMQAAQSCHPPGTETPPAPFTYSCSQTTAQQGAGKVCKHPSLQHKHFLHSSVYSSNSATSPTKSSQRLQRAEAVCCPQGTDDAFPSDPLHWDHWAVVSRGQAALVGALPWLCTAPHCCLLVLLPKFPAGLAEQVWKDHNVWSWVLLCNCTLRRLPVPHTAALKLLKQLLCAACPGAPTGSRASAGIPSCRDHTITEWVGRDVKDRPVPTLPCLDVIPAGVTWDFLSNPHGQSWPL